MALVQYRVGLPYPEPLKDCYRGLCWIWENAEQLGIDRERIAVLGDSAGGALAAGVTLLARDRKGPEICFQMLISPVTDYRMTSWSMRHVCGFAGLDCQAEPSDVGAVSAAGGKQSPQVCRASVCEVFEGAAACLCGNAGDRLPAGRRKRLCGQAGEGRSPGRTERDPRDL